MPFESKGAGIYELVRTICSILCVQLTILVDIPEVESHGRLVEPPSRSTMFRLGFNNPPNYDDTQLSCGGVKVQYEENGGKCGVCGDPWPGPRDNEPGGKYANGIIVRKYSVGQVIDVYVQITANHKGYCEFRLCEHNNSSLNITHECLDKNLLVVDNTGSTRYMLPSGPYSTQQHVRLKLRLPADVSCSACVFQWKYNSGNSWGIDPVTKEGCIGCGNQEQFYGCADIAIGRDDVILGVTKAYERFWEEKTTTISSLGSNQHFDTPCVGILLWAAFVHSYFLFL